MFLIWQKCFLLPFLITKALVGAFRQESWKELFFFLAEGTDRGFGVALAVNLGRGRPTKQTLPPGRGWVGGMEVAGNGVGPFHLGPLTSTPIESSTSSLPARADSLSSENSDSSGEDWLIKVRCPGAKHRYSKRAYAKKSISSRSTKTETSSILDKKDDFTEKTELTPTTSYQDYTKVPRQESADLEWLLRLRCPRAQMEQLMPDLKQSFPGVTKFLSKSQSKVYGRSQSEKTKTSESWLTQKHLSIAQALVNESQDVIGPIQLLLERENCFIREVDRYLKHNDFLALRRREMLYKKWFESVSRPLLQKIQDKVDNQSSKEIEERKRKQLSLYLNYCNEKASSAPGSSVSLCMLLPPFHPLFESQSSPYSSYFPSFLPPFPFSLLSISPSASPPIIVLPSVLLPPSVPSHFFHLLPPFPPYLHSPSIFFPSPFLQLSPTELVSSPNALSSLPKSVVPPTSSPVLQSSAPSATDSALASENPPDSKPKYGCDFSAYHSHNPFFLPILPPIQSQRRYQARQKNSDSVKYP